MSRLARLSSLASSIALAALFASPAAAQWQPDVPVVLKGKVVSMDRGIRQGQVVVLNGKIQAILTASATPPAGAIVIETKGYIYPGMINLHNHLKYNTVSLYPVPKRYKNHDEWPGGKLYSEKVNNPTVMVTGGNLFARIDEALKFAEVRSIVGGETATQGGENNPAIKKSLVRNVEMKNFGEDVVGQRAFTIDNLLFKHFDEQLPKIRAQKAWIFHLGEGIDEYSRWEWSDPNYDPTKPFSSSKSKRNRPGVVEADLVWPGLVGVHCTALKQEDFRQWRQIAGSRPKVVWSPTSNFLLYGQTTDIRAALKEGAIIGLGTDWAPSGTKSLLWELKVVDAYNKKQSPRLFRGYRKIVELVTTNAAKILGWENKVGKIKSGFYADLIVVDKVAGARSGYQNLIMATEENIQLVMVEGNPLYGDEAHMAKLKVYGGKAQYERIPETPDSRPKAIDMLEAPDQRNGTMSLADVRGRLEEALRLDTDALAAHLNAGKRISASKVSFKARDYIRGDLIKWLGKKNKPVRAGLDEADSELLPSDLDDYIAMKYRHLKKIDKLESIYTDDKFLADLEGNIFWKDLGIDLRKYVPKQTNTPGLSGSIPTGD